MIFRFLVVFILSVCCIIPSFGNRNADIIDNIFICIYNHQFSRADSILAEQKGHMEPFYFDILSIDLYWWKYITFQSESDLQRFTELLKELDEKIPETFDHNVKQLVILSYKMRYELKRYNITGAIRLRSQIKQLLENTDPTTLNYTEERIKLFHLYGHMFDYFDNILNPLLLKNKRTTRNNALLAIESYTHENDVIVNTLASYFLGKIYLTIERDPHKGSDCFKKLTERYPQNVIFSELRDKSEKKS